MRGLLWASHQRSDDPEYREGPGRPLRYRRGMPTPPRRWLRRLAIGVAAVAALLIAAAASLPLFVDADRVQRVVERRISALAGGEVRYESLQLRFFPQPYAEARNATVSIPGTLDGRIGTLAVRIALLPLLTGNVRPVAIDIGQPVLELTIRPGGGGTDPFAAYRAALGPVLDALVGEARGMSLGITDGKVDVLSGGQPILSLSALSASARVAADAITVDASGAANFWRTARADLRIAHGSLAATGKLGLSGLRLEELLRLAGAQGDLRAAAAIDVAADVRTDGRESAGATLTATAPAMTLARGNRTLELGAVRTALDAGRDAAALAVTVRELRAGELLPAATGALRAKPDGTAPSLELQIPALDLARLRAALAAIAGDLDAVQAALAFVPTGTAQGLTASAAGADFGALASLGTVRAETGLANGALDLPDQGIRITGATGRFTLADGALRGADLAGTIGKSTFQGGTLAVELAPAAALHELEAALDADLAEALPIVRRLVGRREPAALAGVESLSGRAAGNIAYDARQRPPRVTVDLARIRAAARHRGMPLPITVNAGAVRYAHDRVVVRGLDGALGRSTVRGGVLDLALGPRSTVRSASADAVLVAEELTPWVQSIEGLRIELLERTSITGTATVRLARLAGPLDAPGELDYEVTVGPRDLRLAGPDLPGPMTVASGATRITPGTFALDRLDVSLLDARAVLSGTVQDAGRAEPRFDLALADARAGERSLEWARARWKLPAKAMPRAPVTLAAGRVRRSGGLVDAQGTLGLAGGVSAEFDLTTAAGHFDLRRLVVKDPDTDTTLALKWARERAEFALNGRLDNRTLGRVLVEPPKGDGALAGDFRAVVDLAELRRSSATGTLAGERIDVLERWDIPVAIDRVRLEVAGDVLRIRDSAIAVAGERLGVTGTVTRQPHTFGLDLRVTADAVDGERLLRAFPAGEAKPAGGAWRLPVDGRVAVDAKSIAYGTRVFSPVSAIVTLAPERIVADVKEAGLCGLSLPLNAVLVPGRATLDGRIEVRAKPVGTTVACLTGEQIALTGTCDVDATVAASGPPEALARSARGSFRFTARDGEIQRAPALARMLSLDAVAGLLRARPSDLMAEGLDYSELVIAGTLEAGRVQVTTGTLNAAALGLAMTGEVDFPGERVYMHGVVAPFNRVQGVMQHVPLIGGIFGARVVGIPFSLTGDLRDPLVVPLGPAAVGQSVVNLLGAVVKTPIDLLDPIAERLKRAP